MVDSVEYMGHEIAKLILEHADSVVDRKTAFEKALALDMPLLEIEEYYNWLVANNTRVQMEVKPELLNPGR